MLAAPVSALAQVIPPSEQPGRERERFAVPSPPLARPGGAAVTLPSGIAPPGAERTIIRVRGVRIVGSTVYSADQLAPLYQDVVGQQVTLQTVYDLARRITAKYGSDGYVLSRAIVPPQQLNPRGAVVRIEVVEGYVDKVEWPPALARYRDFFSYYASRIVADRPANVRTLERYLLLAGELPGLKFVTTLKASPSNPRASTLVVQVAEKPIDALARVDNRGTKARGPGQFLVLGTLNNALGAHEALTVGYGAAISPDELQYLSGNYRQVLTPEGLTVFANASYSFGKPGTAPLRTLQFETRSLTTEAGLAYPVIRSRERNLVLSALAFSTDADSDILNTPFNRDHLRGIRLKADGDVADAWLGVNQFNVTVSQGFEGAGSSSNGNLLASRTVGRVDFTKVEGTISRLQPLGAGVSFLAALYGQYASAPLLSPEQCGYGGRFFGRGYDPSQILGDHCLLGIAEVRYDVPGLPSFLSTTQLYAFADFGVVHTRAAAVGTDPNVEAASIGAGLRLGWDKYFNTDLSVAKAIEGPRDDWRFFFIATAKY